MPILTRSSNYPLGSQDAGFEGLKILTVIKRSELVISRLLQKIHSLNGLISIGFQPVVRKVPRQGIAITMETKNEDSQNLLKTKVRGE